MQKVALHVYEDQGSCARVEGGCVREGVGSGAEDLCGHFLVRYPSLSYSGTKIDALFCALLNSFPF